MLTGATGTVSGQNTADWLMDTTTCDFFCSHLFFSFVALVIFIVRFMVTSQRDECNTAVQTGRVCSLNLDFIFSFTSLFQLFF